MTSQEKQQVARPVRLPRRVNPEQTRKYDSLLQNTRREVSRSHRTRLGLPRWASVKVPSSSWPVRHLRPEIPIPTSPTALPTQMPAIPRSRSPLHVPWNSAAVEPAAITTPTPTLTLTLTLALTLALTLSYGGARGNAMRECDDVASANWQDSNQRQLARAPRRGLRGQSSQVHPTTFASRAVRRTLVSRSLGPRS